MLFVEFLGLLSLRAGRHVRGSLLGCLGKRFSGSIGRQSEEISDKKTIIEGGEKNDSVWDMKTPGTGIPSPPTALTLTRRPHRIGRWL